MEDIFIRAARAQCCLTVLLLLINIQPRDMTTFLAGNAPGSVHTVDICQRESFQPRCRPGYVIIIQNATYGRMTLGRCINIDMGYLGCKTDVTALTEWRCSGKNSCDITIPNDEFEQTKPCYELQSYLNVSYYCLKALTVSPHSCSESHFLKTSLASGYLSSQRTTDCSKSNIWLIEARPGQRINLTLVDFGIAPGTGDIFSEMDVCHKYADVQDSVTGKKFVVCGRQTRTKHILTSLGNAVEVDFSGRNVFTGEDMSEFLIHFNVVGCTDPPLTPNTWSKRQGQKLLIGCKDGGSLYEITCQGNMWHGSYRNCTTDDSSLAATYQEDDFMFSPLPKGLVIAAIVAIAVVVGTVIVVVGIVVFKRRRTLDYVDGTYTIPNAEKVYVSPDPRHHSNVHTLGQHHQQGSKALHHHPPPTTGSERKYHASPAPIEGLDSRHKEIVEHEYHCVDSTAATPHVPADRRGHTQHIWDRPTPAPESQHSC